MKFGTAFDVNDSDSRMEFIINQYIALSKIDSRNELLKYAGVTSHEVFWSKTYSSEFDYRFSQIDLGLSAKTPKRVTLEMNYAIALLEEIDKLTPRMSVKSGNSNSNDTTSISDKLL